MKILKISAYAIIFLLAFAPALYIIIFNGNSIDFSNFSSFARGIGKIFGLSGTILFSLTFLLNTRMKLFEEILGGLDQVYIMHHNIGTIAFLLILFHPIFLSLQFIMFSIKSTAEFFYTFNNFAINLGFIALISMILFLALTFFSILKYKQWKFTHRLLGVSFIIASIHILIVPSDVSRDLFLKGYFILFILIGICSYFYRTVFWRFLVRRHDFKIKSIKSLDGINEIILEPQKFPLKFKPGQFIFISIDSKITSKEPHPFTISSSSHRKNIILSVKKLGDFTERLDNLKEGIPVKLEGPYGKFSFLNYPSKNYVFIAGGIGITPFLSMIRSIQDFPDKYSFESIDIYYSVKNKNEAVFLEELKNISKNLPKNKKMNIFINISDKEGHITSEYISNNSKNLSNSEIFLCGPPKMMESLKKQLIKSGVKKNKIKTEEFALL